LACSIGTACRL